MKIVSHEKITSMKNNIKLDPASDRYRICPYDGVQYMAHHRGMIFCCDKCADEFHNRLKRQKLSDKNLEVAVTQIKFVPSEHPPPKVETGKELTVTEIKSDPIKPRTHNLKILDLLQVDSNHGTVVSLMWLDQQDYIFDIYDGRAQLYNIPSTKKCHFLQIGNYRIYSRI